MERFGNSADLVVFGGANITHKFSDTLSLSGGYEAINFSDNTNPQRTDHFAYARVKINTDPVDFDIYGEIVRGERCLGSICVDKNRYSISASAMIPLTPQTSWEVATGLSKKGQKNQKTIETSLYHNFTKDFSATAGFGHDFESNDNIGRFGISYDF